MYLIQDIVVNHTGIFFGYDGEYDSSDTSQHFALLEQGHQAATDTAPFHMVDRNNPEHAAANIYDWTPSASNYQSDEQQFTYQPGNLPVPKNHKIYFDPGTETLDAYYPPLQAQADEVMRRRGFDHNNWITNPFIGDAHDEISWNGRLHIPLLFLLGK